MDSQDVPAATVVASGVAAEKNGRVYDRFRSRIMFPITDANARVVGFTGRVFGAEVAVDGEPLAKYVNTPQTAIYDKSRIYTPDHVVVVDPTLVEAIDITEGLKPGGTIIINSDRRPEDFAFRAKFKVRTIDATKIAVAHKLGSLAAPIVNTAIAGAVIKVLGLTKIESLAAAIRDGLAIRPEDNVQAAREAYEQA